MFPSPRKNLVKYIISFDARRMGSENFVGLSLLGRDSQKNSVESHDFGDA